MAASSFEIKDCSDFFEALQGAAADFRDDPTSSRKAVSAFLFAYHLREWVWKKHEEEVTAQMRCLTESQFNELVNRCHENFWIIREICNGLKHFEIRNRKNNEIASSGLTGGSFSSGFSPAFDIGRLAVTIDGRQISAEHLLEDVISYYQRLFDQLRIT